MNIEIQLTFDSVAARNLIKKLDFKNNFYLFQCIAQTYLDESRFKDDGSELRPYLNMRKWSLAEKYINKAFTINDDNAEVLYTIGVIRKIGSREDIAIYCFKRIGIAGQVIQRYLESIGNFCRHIYAQGRLLVYAAA